MNFIKSWANPGIFFSTKRAPLSKRVYASRMASSDVFLASYPLQAPSSADGRYQVAYASPSPRFFPFFPFYTYHYFLLSFPVSFYITC